MTLSPTVRLNNGVSMPCFGLGVYKMPPGATTQKAVATALKLGYRLIDTARWLEPQLGHTLAGMVARAGGFPAPRTATVA